jgi:hypothetical protein
MLTVEGAAAKRTFIEKFLVSDYDCQVVISEDESEDIEVINAVIRDMLVATTYNTVLCVGAEAPVFITPRDGISTKSKIILVVDAVPDTWTLKANVATFRGVLAATSEASVQIIKQ